MSRRRTWASSTPRRSSAAVSPSRPEPLRGPGERSTALTVVFFGDGAMEEGVFYEALNIAKLWQLPMIFWMENNYRRTGRGAGHAATELTNVPKALQVETTVIDGIDVGTVRLPWRSSGARALAKNRCSSKRAPSWPGNAFAMPKLIGGITDIAWAWNASAAPENVRGGTQTVIRYCTIFANSKAPASAERRSSTWMCKYVRKPTTARFALESPLPEPQAALHYAFAGQGH